MPRLTITEEQAARLESLRADLEAELVGAYGTVRPDDALEFLLDRHDADDRPLAAVLASLERDDRGCADGATSITEDGTASITEDDTASTTEDGTPPTTEDDTPPTTEDGATRPPDGAETTADPGEDGEGGQRGDAGDVEAGGDASSEEGAEPPRVSAAVDDVEDVDDEGPSVDELMRLLKAHEDKWWRTEDGDALYAVKLPDGGTASAQSQDDVRAIILEHYR